MAAKTKRMLHNKAQSTTFYHVLPVYNLRQIAYSLHTINKMLRESGKGSNSFTFKLCTVVVNGSENKQNVTLLSLFDEDLPCFTHI